jgi:hypothetical protein
MGNGEKSSNLYVTENIAIQKYSSDQLTVFQDVTIKDRARVEKFESRFTS